MTFLDMIFMVSIGLAFGFVGIVYEYVMMHGLPRRRNRK